MIYVAYCVLSVNQIQKCVCVCQIICTKCVARLSIMLSYHFILYVLSTCIYLVHTSISWVDLLNENQIIALCIPLITAFYHPSSTIDSPMSNEANYLPANYINMRNTLLTTFFSHHYPIFIPLPSHPIPFHPPPSSPLWWMPSIR